MKKNLEEANTQSETKSKAYSNIETIINQLNISINERNLKLNEALNSLNIALEANGFSNIDNLLESFADEKDFEALQAEKEKLNKENASTEKELKLALDDFEKTKALNKTQKSKEELNREQTEIDFANTEDNQKIGEINNKLKIDKENRNKYEELNTKYEKDKWETVKTFIGKQDGSDFEVFVEALAFKTLIKKANKYVFAISGKYTLVQKDGGVDFVVHDANYPEAKDDRPISTMSGGEKFIISLSLALGIAELASRNVRVDSLFLDEGFGTLSGTPLIEAINALKSLQNSGKMLGIITHIDTVINEFEQRIEAKKKAGGYSELVGSGITKD